MTVSEQRERLLWLPTLTRRRSLSWVARYQWEMVAADAACGLLAGLIALAGRFSGAPHSLLYVISTAGLPLISMAWVGAAGGYDPRFIGLGSEEFRRIINAALLSLTAAIAILSYAFKVDFARGYVLIAVPALGAADGRPVPDAQAAAPAAETRAAHAAGDRGGSPGRRGRPDRAAAPRPFPRARGGNRAWSATP